jgi:GT2 family glycosyltransferase
MGEIMPVEYTPRSLSRLTEDIISQMDADAWLFWDGDLGWPEETSIQTLLEKTGDVFHAGLQLGMGGLPEVINYIRPTWMHNCDPSPAIEATSWRLSLRCCLIRGEVLRQLGGVLPQFQTLTGAGLELGYRFIQQGVVVRNTPLLIDPPKMIKDPVIVPFHDQALFLNLHFNRFWNRYALWRAWRNNIISLGQLINYYRNVKKNLFSKDIFNPVFRKNDKVWTQAQVSVLIPTLGRYDYLSKLLSQLRDQTLKPLEIIIVDQNDDLLREDLKSRFPDLPLTIIKQNKRGQSTARNAGLYVARGTHILFIDDDDEVPSDLIQKHVEALNAERCEVSCGVAHEKGAGPLRGFSCTGE